MELKLKEELLAAGATVVGIAAVEEAISGDIAHLNRAVSIGVCRSLKDETLELLASLQKLTEVRLRAAGYRYMSIPPDSDRINTTFISKLYPMFTHKIAATCAGIGWIGRSGLLISRDYGPRLSLATILTDAPLMADEPMLESQCGNCMLCLEHCPSDAITGEDWSRKNPFPDLVDPCRCASHKKQVKAAGNKPNCGLCMIICPYGRTNGDREAVENKVSIQGG